VRQRAGLQAKEKPARKRLGLHLKRGRKKYQKRTIMSDEKIFAMDENHEGGYWMDVDEEDPEVHKWQNCPHEHVWGAITWEGALRLVFLDGGTFRGQACFEKDLAALQKKKAAQRSSLTAPSSS
jgi:hypothetical protein